MPTSTRKLRRKSSTSRGRKLVKSEPCHGGATHIDGGASVSDKLEALKNLIPSSDDSVVIKPEQLYQETAEYILLLKSKSLPSLEVFGVTMAESTRFKDLLDTQKRHEIMFMEERTLRESNEQHLHSQLETLMGAQTGIQAAMEANHRMLQQQIQSMADQMQLYNKNNSVLGEGLSAAPERGSTSQAMTETGELKMLSAKSLGKSFKKQKYGILGQLFSVTLKAIDTEPPNEELNTLLNSYSDIFSEPTNLPP
ncbi:hypothetical protein BUALT_Bualt16G0021400 [Buddleja alternifolia]|uniref:Uncharacterized protein n=1 Tax=Buddleja alternifolia TaxID=168488 RepID=A0AAV6WDS6_9LAMI|nr:hypothetical protein BUALT_Bualt16G0021400 [Buddleja alternifolia]